jgi:hypothetical protein
VTEGTQFCLVSGASCIFDSPQTPSKPSFLNDVPHRGETIFFYPVDNIESPV